MQRAVCISVLFVSAVAPAVGSSLQDAAANAVESRRAIRLCNHLAYGWLGQADPVSGLLPRNLTRDWYWNARDAAADNFPFYLLTAFVTDNHHLKRTFLSMLEQETKLTNRLDRLPDDFLFDRQSFRPEPYRLASLIFGASEYAKDGLTPITDWLGAGPWLERMIGLVQDIWKHASAQSESGVLPSDVLEVNGNMLQVCSRLYWLTGEEDYRQWVFRLADHFFLHENILEASRLQLDDHSCEIIGGLAEASVIAARTDPERWQRYRPRMHAILDRILEVGRNEDGLLYNVVNPVTGEVLSRELTDNWGYNYNAFLTIAQLDNDSKYREPVEMALNNIHKYLDYKWERGGADGYADSIEGGINLLNRIPVESAFDWVNRSMDILFAKQGDDGIVEGWHGDGNSARTALMYALWKTQGIAASPWREDLELGAVRAADGSLQVYVKNTRPWRGKLRFDRKRHRDYFHLPFDYPRINQFPEWFTVDKNAKYEIAIQNREPKVVDGEELWAYELVLKPNEPVEITVKPLRQ